MARAKARMGTQKACCSWKIHLSYGVRLVEPYVADSGPSCFPVSRVDVAELLLMLEKMSGWMGVSGKLRRERLWLIVGGSLHCCCVSAVTFCKLVE